MMFRTAAVPLGCCRGGWPAVAQGNPVMPPRSPHLLRFPAVCPAAAEATRCLKNGVLVENDAGSVGRYLEEHPELAAQIGVPRP